MSTTSVRARRASIVGATVAPKVSASEEDRAGSTSKTTTSIPSDLHAARCSGTHDGHLATGPLSAPGDREAGEELPVGPGGLSDRRLDDVSRGDRPDVFGLAERIAHERSLIAEDGRARGRDHRGKVHF